jgi:hypothetical protein
MQLKEAMVATAAAKLAQSSGVAMPRVARLTTSSGNQSREDMNSSATNSSNHAVNGKNGCETNEAKKGKVICERIVDVRNQLSASRELTTAAHGLQPSPAEADQHGQSPPDSTASGAQLQTDAGPIITAAETECRRSQHILVSTENDFMVDEKMTSAAGKSGSSLLASDVVQPQENGGKSLLSKKKTVSFENSSDGEMLSSGMTASVEICKEKPPIGKVHNEPAKKSENGEKRKDKKSAAAVDTGEKVEMKNDSSGKMSFFKSLLTRSRSPSPKRGRSNRSPSPSAAAFTSSPKDQQLSSEAGRRLSDPLKFSFKQQPPPPDMPNMKVNGTKKLKDNKKKSKNKKSKTIDDTTVTDESGSSEVQQTSITLEMPVQKNGESLLRNNEDSDSVPGKASSSMTITGDNEPTDVILPKNIGKALYVSENSLPDSTSSRTHNSYRPVPATITNDVMGGHSEPVSRSMERRSTERRSAHVIPSRSIVSSSNNDVYGSLGHHSSVCATNPENPWLVNLKDLKLKPNLDSFKGEKLFQKGTATTRLILPGFQRPDQGLSAEPTLNNRKNASPVVMTNDSSAPNACPIYDTVYADNSADGIYKSTLELGNNRSSLKLQRAESIGKSFSLQDLKSAAVRYPKASSTAETSNGSSALRSKIDHAIDEEDSVLENRLANSFDADVNVDVQRLKSPKTVSCEKVREMAALPPEPQRLENPHIEKYFQGVSVCSQPDSGRKVGPPVPVKTFLNRTASASKESHETDEEMHLKLTKSSSLPTYCRNFQSPIGGFAPITPVQEIPDENCHSPNTYHDQAQVCNRDTIISLYLDDLSQSQQDLANMYKYQKLERQREQEMAKKEKERLESIERMWMEFDHRPSTQKASAVDEKDGVKVQKAEENVRVCANGKKFSGNEDELLETDTIKRRPKQQIEKSFDELLEEFHLTAREAEQPRRPSRTKLSEVPPEPQCIPAEGRSAAPSPTSTPSSASARISPIHRIPTDDRGTSQQPLCTRTGSGETDERNAVIRVHQPPTPPPTVSGESSSGTGFGSGRPRASSYSQKVVRNVGGDVATAAAVANDRTRSQTLRRPKDASKVALTDERNMQPVNSPHNAVRTSPSAAVDLEHHSDDVVDRNGRRDPTAESRGQQQGHGQGQLKDGSSDADDNNTSSSCSSSATYILNSSTDRLDSRLQSLDKPRSRLIEEQLKAIHDQVLKKQAAIRTLEMEREQCLEMERRLQSEIKLDQLVPERRASEDRGSSVRFRDAGKVSPSSAADPEPPPSPPSSTRTAARPLTRYLPVRGDDNRPLNLRQFIEAAGHNLAQPCCHVDVTATTCHGFLSKLGRRGFGGWKRRWFVFDRSRRCLSYYGDDKMETTTSRTSTRRAIYFQSIRDVFVDHRQTVRSPNPTLTFCVKTLDRTLYLLAPTPECMRIWIDVIFTGAEGYQQFL